MLAGLIDADALSAALDKFLPEDAAQHAMRPRRSSSRQRSVSVAVSDLSEATTTQRRSVSSGSARGVTEVELAEPPARAPQVKKSIRHQQAVTSHQAPAAVSKVAAATSRAMESLRAPLAVSTTTVGPTPAPSSVKAQRHRDAQPRSAGMSSALEEHLKAHNINPQGLAPLAQLRTNSTSSSVPKSKPTSQPASGSDMTQAASRREENFLVTQMEPTAGEPEAAAGVDATNATMIWSESKEEADQRTQSPKQLRLDAKNTIIEAVGATLAKDELPTTKRFVPVTSTSAASDEVRPARDENRSASTGPEQPTCTTGLSKLLIARNARLRVVNSRSRSRSPSTSVTAEHPSTSPLGDGGEPTPQHMPAAFRRMDEPSPLLMVVTAWHCHQLRQCVLKAPTNRILAAVLSAVSLPELCHRVRSTFAPSSVLIVGDLCAIPNTIEDDDDEMATRQLPSTSRPIPALYFEVDGKMILAVALAGESSSGSDETRLSQSFWHAAIQCHRRGFAMDGSIASSRGNSACTPFQSCTWLDLAGGGTFPQFAEVFANFPFRDDSSDPSCCNINYYSLMSADDKCQGDGRHALEPLIAPSHVTSSDLAGGSDLTDGVQLSPLCWFGVVLEGSASLSNRSTVSNKTAPLDVGRLLKLTISRHVPRFLVFEAAPGHSTEHPFQFGGTRRFDRRLVLVHGHILQHVGAVDGAVVDMHSRSIGLAIPQVAQCVADTWIQCRGQNNRKRKCSVVRAGNGSLERLVFDALAIAQQRRWQRVGIVVTESVNEDEFDTAMDALLQWQFPFPRALVAFHGDANCFPAQVVESAFEEVADMRQALQSL